MAEKKFKTRCYYTEYVNHMIRFYLSCPDSLKTDGKRKSDIENWIAVQTVFHCLSNENKAKLKDIFGLNFNIEKAVNAYCEKTGADKYATWVLVTKVSAMIARRRGLV